MSGLFHIRLGSRLGKEHLVLVTCIGCEDENEAFSLLPLAFVNFLSFFSPRDHQNFYQIPTRAVITVTEVVNQTIIVSLILIVVISRHFTLSLPPSPSSNSLSFSPSSSHHSIVIRMMSSMKLTSRTPHSHSNGHYSSVLWWR